MLDIAINGSRVLDPETKTDAILNVGVKNGVIDTISSQSLDAKRIIEGAALVLAPGFIDIHTHEDLPAYDTGGAFRFPLAVSQCALRTGCTTIVTGNCGMSNFPIAPYLAQLASHRLPVNTPTLVGNCALREHLGLGTYDAASAAQIDKMTALAREALQAGAVGVSFGLQYAPGTSFAEFAALAKAAADCGKFFSVHMRHDTCAKAAAAVEEALEAARVSGAGLQISHFAANVYGNYEGVSNIEKCARLIEESRLDVSADVYPYDAWACTIKSAVFDNGFADFNFKVGDLEILSGPLAGTYCTEAVFAELREADADTAVACHNAIDERDIEAAYKLPFAFAASDSYLTVDKSGAVKGHPRSAGSPARFLSRYVREKRVVSLMEGVQKLTLDPARRLALPNKGRIQEGCDADLVLFDAGTIQDRASYGEDKCTLAPQGIRAVIAGGKIAYEGV